MATYYTKSLTPELERFRNEVCTSLFPQNDLPLWVCFYPRFPDAPAACIANILKLPTNDNTNENTPAYTTQNRHHNLNKDAMTQVV
jgi:hypothetical protein